MGNTYILKISSLLHTFSLIESGIDFSFKYNLIANDQLTDILRVLQEGDTFFCVIGEHINSYFSIKTIDEKNVIVNKIIEVAKGYRINDIGILKKLEEELIYKIEHNFKTEILNTLSLNIKEDIPYISFYNSSCKDEIKPHNRIIFGAPGTGKSYQLNQDANVFGNNYERVTFHPNYSYAQFVGTYKPTMYEKQRNVLTEEQQKILSILRDKTKTAQEKYDSMYEDFKDRDLTRLPILLGLFTDDNFKTKKADGTPAVGDNSVERNHGKAIRPFVNLDLQNNSNKKITYSYVPGPFIRVLEKALYSQQIGENKPYLLIIEEINRAVVSAVFGDVFQLLDRNENGESQYEIDVSEDLYNYLTSEDDEQTGHRKINIGKKLKIPSNMYIWATMNSADQGVQPMDAAFKRRWDFEYLPLDEHEKDIESYQLPFPEKDIGYQLKYWKDVRAKINELLKKVGNINEDKLLGPFFISETNLKKYNKIIDKEKAKEFSKLFKSKVLMYLYEDVCKINPKLVFPNIKSKNGLGKIHFSDVCDAFDENGIGVFEG